MKAPIPQSGALPITRIATGVSFHGYLKLQLKYYIEHSALENKNGLWTYYR
jgi:hypothetical protein